MNITINGHSTYCYTGGKPLDAAKPTVVFVHGGCMTTVCGFCKAAISPTTAGTYWHPIYPATAEAGENHRRQSKRQQILSSA